MRKLILFLLVGIFLVSGVYAECYGGADLDINKIERTPGQSTFKVIATANQAGDCLRVAWTKEQINQILERDDPEKIAEKDITGDVKLISQTEKFLTYSYERLPVYNIEEGSYWGSCENSCLEKEGYSSANSDERYSIRNTFFGIGVGKCYCIYPTNLDNSVGVFGSRTFNDKVEISFSDLPTATISTTYSENEEPVGTTEIDEKVLVTYRGSLIGNNWIEKPEFNPFKSGANYKLVLGNSADAKKERDELLNCLNGSSSSSIAESCISGYENTISSLFSSDKKGEWISNEPIVENAHFLGNDFIVEKGVYSTQWPQFTLTFDAEWAGVHWVTGQPEITCPSDDSFSSGASKSLKFNVKNIADEKGAFSLSLDCSGVSSTLNKNKVSLDSGSSEEITATLTASTEEAKEVSCNLKAYATREPSKSDECSFNVEVIPLTSVSADELNNSEISGQTSASTSKDSSTGIIILIIFLVIISGSIGFFVYVKNKKVKSESSKNTEKTSHKSKCKKCGHPLKLNSKFCTKCGEKQK